MADTGGKHNAQVLPRDVFGEPTLMYDTIHHLRHAETMAEVMERVVPVILLNA